MAEVGEQQQIANFLDKKTAQIDELIDKKEKMLKLLKEKRSAIINQAVTCGLDENGNLRQKPRCLPASGWKPSGIEWIGDIPEGWDVDKLKYISFTKVSNVDKHSKEGEISVHLCNYVDVYYRDFIDCNIDFMQATATREEIRKFSLIKGDVLITKDSETWDDIAIPSYVMDDFIDVLCGYHLAIIRANQNMCKKYIFWSFLSQNINSQFQISAIGVTRYGLGKSALDNAIFLVPPKEEQQLIAEYLDKITKDIDVLISKIKNAMGKLAEYRKSLITAAVTGKIDVHEGNS